MSYNGSGTFNINSAGQPVVTGTVISSTAFNALTADLGTGLSTALTKDGQTVATARIPFAAGINSSLITDATNTTTGSIITAGGVGIAKALFVGTTANIAGTTTLAGVTATSITDSGLTSGRVTFASTSGLLADAAALAWDGTSLSATKFAGALNGTVGATTPAAGAFTTGTFSSTLAVTGITTVAAGSAALPAIVSTTGTADTGLWFPAADTVAASTAGTERLRIDSAGNVLIGTTTGNADARLTPSGGSTDSSPCIDFSKGSATTTTSQVFARFFCNNNATATGSITANGVSAATFTGYSDRRLKENITDLPSQLANIMALRPVEFDFKGYEPGEGHQIGFIAQDVQLVYPDVVGEGTDGMLTLSDMNKNDARLIKCIQEQQALILALTDRIAALEAK